MEQPDEWVIRPFRIADEEAVVALWRDCDLLRPQNNPHRDIQRKLKVQPEMFLVAEQDGEILGTVMAGYDGHRGWINYLGVAPAHQRKGIARGLMAEAERLLRAASCPKINLQVRATNSAVLAFYHAIGFVDDPVLSLGKRLESDLEAEPTG